MKNISKIFLLITIFCNLLSSQIKEEIVAKINDENIYLSDVEKMKENIKQQYFEFSYQFPPPDELFKAALDRIIEEKLLIKEAEKEKINVFPYEIDREIDAIKKRIAISEGISDLQSSKIESVFNEKLKQQNMTLSELKDNIKKKMKIEKLLEQKVKAKIKQPTDSELKNFFNTLLSIFKSSNSVNFNSDEEKEFYMMISERFKEAFGERVRYRQILIKPNSYNEVDIKKATERANLIKKRILNGEDFEDIALKESADTLSAKNGGDVGYVVRGNLPPNIENIVFSLNPGEISEPIWTDSECFLIQVIEKKIAEKPKFEKVKQDLENILIQKKFAQEIENYVNKLKNNAVINIYKK
ncbi:MAG: peptidylprolyl isomerase [Elusimicrobiales bacterium]|nr:peptidylprolyl isomerase [Elusimicrobiales bacterium]